MSEQNRKSVEGVPTLVFVIDAADANPDNTEAWVSELRAVGLNAFRAAWPRIRGTRLLAAPRDIRHFRRTLTASERLVLIGTSAGGQVAYKLLLAGKARGAVLIAPGFRPDVATGSHGPMLLLEGAEIPRFEAEVIRATGACDLQLIDSPRASLTDGECGANLAEYIHGWLTFHQLADQ